MSNHFIVPDHLILFALLLCSLQRQQYYQRPFTTFSNGSIQVSWNPPAVSPHCCGAYYLTLTPDNSNIPPLIFNTTENTTTFSGLLVRDVTYAARVMCATSGSGTLLPNSCS